MKKIIIITLAIVLILGATILFVNAKSEDEMPYTRFYTKAICTNDNFCQDYEIFCKNEDLVKLSPVTGAAIQFSENWQDIRDSETRNKIC